MARKPNYSIERNNRVKAKAAKREAKRQAKLAVRAQKASAAATDEKTADDSPAEPAEAKTADHGQDNRTY